MTEKELETKAFKEAIAYLSKDIVRVNERIQNLAKKTAPVDEEDEDAKNPNWFYWKGEAYKNANDIEDARGCGAISDSIFRKGMAFFEKHKQDEEDKRMLFRKTLGVLGDLKFILEGKIDETGKGMTSNDGPLSQNQA